MSRRSTGRTGVDLYYSTSTDGGATWQTEQRLTSQTSANLTDLQEWGDYNGFSILADRAIGTWTDNRDGPPNSKDVYVVNLDSEVAPAGFSLFTETNASRQACVASGADVLDDVILNVASVAEFSNTVNLSFNPALISGFSGDFDPESVIPAWLPAQSSVSLEVAATVAKGDYSITVEGNATGADTFTFEIPVTVYDQVPTTPTLLTPVDAAGDTDPRPAFTWSAVADATNYVLQVATDQAFTDIVLQAGTSETMLVPSYDLPSSSTLYWRVMASNLCGAGPVSDIFHYTSSPAPGDCPVGESTLVEFYDDMENGTNGWAHSAASGADTWIQNQAASQSPDTAWSGQDVASVSDQRLVSPGVSLGSGAITPTLQYYTQFGLEAATGGCFDGGVLEVSTNGGVSWAQVEDGRLLTLPYVGMVSNAYSNPIGGQSAWCGFQEWTRSVVDLSGFEGETLTFRFRLGTDSLVPADYWYIDDVKVQTCQPVVADPLIFEDGFEGVLP